MIAWHVWCDVKGKTAEQNQIHNNIRSLGLAGAAGYQSPGFQPANSVKWLEVWTKCVGKDEVKKLLAEQDLSDNEKYNKVVQ